MAIVRVNARDIIVEVEDETPDTWLRVERLQSVTLSLGENEETADITDFDDEGAYSQDIMQRGASMELSGLEVRDRETGELPPGRARIEALAGEDKVGYDSQGRIRFRYPADQQWRVWNCTVSLGEKGGAVNDKSAWAATIVKCGRTITIPVEEEP